MSDLIQIAHWTPQTAFVECCLNGRWLKPDFAFQRYTAGKAKPNYPVPALLVDSVSDLSVRWSQWIDTDAIYGHRY